MNHNRTAGRPSGRICCHSHMGTTFISTKVLLRFSPVEILFIRFVMGYLALWLACPRSCAAHRRQEGLYAAAGSAVLPCISPGKHRPYLYSGIQRGVIISIAPFFTAILGWMFLEERDHASGSCRILLAMAGISLISFGNEAALSLNPTGDLLAVAAAVIWAVYSPHKNQRIGPRHCPEYQKDLFTGLFMVPALTFMDFYVTLAQFTDMKIS